MNVVAARIKNETLFDAIEFYKTYINYIMRLVTGKNCITEVLHSTSGSKLYMISKHWT
jgi:hypothetical protein